MLTKMHQPNRCTNCVAGYPKPCLCGGEIHAEPGQFRHGARSESVYVEACTLCEDPEPFSGWPTAADDGGGGRSGG